jgi:Large polyvalent protein-associated domain 7
MSATTNNSSAVQPTGQTGEADTLDLDGRQALKGRARPQHPSTVGSAARTAETQRAAAEGQASIDPLVADQAIAANDKRDNSAKPQKETQQTAEVSPGDLQPSKASPSTSTLANQPTTTKNELRASGPRTEKRRAIPPLEDRFNIKRVGLVQRAFHFRDQTGKLAFTDKFLSISTTSESPAAIKAMVDRAAERGWQTVRLAGSQEFIRQGWIAATAQGLRAVGYTPSAGDQEAAVKERARLQVSQDTSTPQSPRDAIQQVPSARAERVAGDRGASTGRAQRQLATAIEKALTEGKVSPELRSQVRTMMQAEGAKRAARGDRLSVPVYDIAAARARAPTPQPDSQRQGNRERSR